MLGGIGGIKAVIGQTILVEFDHLATDMIKTSSIFKDETFVSAGYNLYIDQILHRSNEIKIYMSHLARILRNTTPGNVFVYGKMGTGKTMVTKSLTSHLEKVAAENNIKVKTIYIHCEAINTNVQIFRYLIHQISLLTSPEKIKIPNSFDAYFLKFCDTANQFGGKIIIIFDEIDKLVNPDILNLLSRLKESGYTNQNVCIIGITNDITFDQRLDARTKSILAQTEIVFPSYDANQLRDILYQRAEMAFIPGVLDDSVIPLCAAYAAQEHGDARKSIELIKISGVIAEERTDTKVTDIHVNAARERIEKNKITELIRTLPSQSKIVMSSCIIASVEKSSHTGEIYNIYRKLCNAIGIDILTQRRITDILSELSTMGLLNALEISRGRYGRTKQVTLAITANAAWDVLIEDFRLKCLKDIDFNNLIRNC